MRTLVFGAGALGSLFSARLLEAGHDVTLLARGRRLEDLRAHGVVLEAPDGERETYQVPLTDELAEHDRFELVIVVTQKHQALEVTPTLARNRHVDTIVFLMNSAAPPEELGRVVGAERLMLGFPTAAGQRDGVVTRVVPIRPWPMPLGEPDGRVTERTRNVADLLASMRDQRVQIRRDIDAYLVSHVALLFSVLGLYAAGLEPSRFARTRDAVVLGLRATEEAFRAQQAAGIPVTPSGLSALPLVPEPLAVAALKPMIRSSWFGRGMFGRPAAARDELAHLIAEFRERVAPAGVAMPALDELAAYIVEHVEPLPEGSSDLPLRWGGTLALGGAAAAAALALVLRRRR